MRDSRNDPKPAVTRPATLDAPARPDGPSSPLVWVDSTDQLVVLGEPHVDVVVLRRHGYEALAAYAAEVAARLAVDRAVIAEPGRPGGLDGVDAFAEDLPADDARDALVEDVAYWVEVTAELTGAPRVLARLVRRAGLFHPEYFVAYASLRLVCTYAGAPPEWVDERDVDRAVVRTPGLGPAAAVRLGAVHHRAAALDVVLLKGNAWPGKEDRGVVFRHAPTETPRLVLLVEPMWA